VRVATAGDVEAIVEMKRQLIESFAAPDGVVCRLARAGGSRTAWGVGARDDPVCRGGGRRGCVMSEPPLSIGRTTSSCPPHARRGSSWSPAWSRRASRTVGCSRPNTVSVMPWSTFRRRCRPAAGCTCGGWVDHERRTTLNQWPVLVVWQLEAMPEDVSADMTGPPPEGGGPA